MRETTQNNTSATFRAFQKQAGLPRAPASSCLLTLHRDGQCPGQHLILIVPALWGQLPQGGSDVGHCLCRQVMPSSVPCPAPAAAPLGTGPFCWLCGVQAGGVWAEGNSRLNPSPVRGVVWVVCVCLGGARGEAGWEADAGEGVVEAWERLRACNRLGEGRLGR